ncbi:uncharacterized protein atf7ip2 [Pungitius pungitius]|uniref:uncharacterized protein atf7ip2 n=1 Tax=Pungitius pungitius TaxID=134920 RepID=UPI002E0D3F80
MSLDRKLQGGSGPKTSRSLAAPVTPPNFFGGEVIRFYSSCVLNMADCTGPKKKRRKPSATRETRVGLGSAFDQWRKIKVAKGYGSDAEMAWNLLGIMNRTAASSTAANEKIRCSQSEVQTLVEQEVHAAVQGREANLQALIETVQQLDCTYESSIQKLQAQITRVTRRAEAAIAFMTKEQTKSPTPSLDKMKTNGAGSEGEAGGVAPQKTNKKSKCRRLVKIMENTKEALNKLQVDNEALKVARADSSEEQPPPVLTPYGSPKGKENALKTEPRIKQETQKSVENKPEEPKGREEPMQWEEPEQREETIKGEEPNEREETIKWEGPEQREEPKQRKETIKWEGPDQREEPKQREETMKWEGPDQREEPNQREETIKWEGPDQREEPKASPVKVEFLPLRESCSPECKVSEKVSEKFAENVLEKGYKLLYPPLPPNNFPPSLKMKAASYSIPQRLQVHVALIRNPAGLSVLWTVEEDDPFGPPMASYSVFMTAEKVKDSNEFPEWTRAEVEAKPLPMCMMISKYKPGRKVCVAVVGRDAFGRYGPYSKVVTAFLPD